MVRFSETSISEKMLQFCGFLKKKAAVILNTSVVFVFSLLNSPSKQASALTFVSVLNCRIF